jgi:D-serine deaminase-like pyridoxal phosphate-dependent protein
MIYEGIDTPSLLVDIDILTNNIKTMQNLVKGTNIKLRPHTKTHKCPKIAKMQLEEGACGITVAKLGEAEVMADNGIKDIFIAYPVFGELKKARLIKLLGKADIIISLDSFVVASFLSDVGKEISKKISILFEINTGLNRCGVEPDDPESMKLAKKISELPGVKIIGLMGYSGNIYMKPDRKSRNDEAFRQFKILMDFKKKFQIQGIKTDVISTGSTLSAEYECKFDGLTELRPGTYIFNDRTQIAIGRSKINECAATILSTVVSTPVPDRVIIDAGSKSLASDILMGDISNGFGSIKGRPDLIIEKINEEHGFMKSYNGKINLNIGDRLEIIPNHICTAVCNFDKIHITQNKLLIDEYEVSGRGKLQ